MFDFVVIRRRQVRAHTPVHIRYHNPTLTRWVLLIDPIFDMEAFLLAFLTKGFGILVRTYAAYVPHGVWGKAILRATGSILRSTARDELCAAGEEIVI